VASRRGVAEAAASPVAEAAVSDKPE